MRFKVSDLRTDAFRSAVSDHEKRGGFTGYPLQLIGGHVVIAGAWRIADTIGDKRNGRRKAAA